jgi:hypothetical protein
MSPEEFQRLPTDARPRLSWRIGITGHRDLSAVDEIELRRWLDQVFGDVAEGLQSVQKRPDVEQVFAPGAPVVAVTSALAEGADRLCADIAVRRGFELRAPLPFAEGEYKHDFPTTVKAFDGLLKYARDTGGVIELDGNPQEGDPRNRAYMAAGEFVVHNCDLLIALWNGEPAQGYGGTGDVVTYARRSGVPVVHIQTVEPYLLFIARAGANAWEAYSPENVKATIASQIVPKVRAHAKHGGKRTHSLEEPSLRAAERYFRHEPIASSNTEPDFLYAGPFAARTPVLAGLSHVFPSFVRLLGRGPHAVEDPAKADPPCGKNERSARYLFLHHHRADVLAAFYANVHRSAFLLVYALGAVALSCAIAALYFHEQRYIFTGLELFVLAVIAGLVIADNQLRWRDRWLEYRLLAELLREADLLAQIGHPMPMATVDELAHDLPGRAWVTVAYSAIVRRAGLVSARFDPAFLAKMRDYAADTRLQDQIAYHHKTEGRAESIASALRWVGFTTFVATAIVGGWKIGLHGPDYLSLFAGILPAIAYACFGIRNQAEFEMVSRRSERMLAKLTRHKQRIKALTGDRLTSAALAGEILDAAAVMRHDAADWASIFEVKETEAG